MHAKKEAEIKRIMSERTATPEEGTRKTQRHMRTCMHAEGQTDRQTKSYVYNHTYMEAYIRTDKHTHTEGTKSAKKKK